MENLQQNLLFLLGTSGISKYTSFTSPRVTLSYKYHTLYKEVTINILILRQ